MENRSKNDQSPWVAATMGVELAGSIAAGALIGWLFDQWLNSAPRGVTIGAILGIVGGGLNFVRQAIRISRGSPTITPRKRVSPDMDPPLPPPERRSEQDRAGRYDPRGPVDVLEDDDDDPEPRLPPDHDKW